MNTNKGLMSAVVSAVNFCILLAGIIVSPRLIARTLEPAPDLDAWIGEIRGASLPLQTVPQRLLLLDSTLEEKTEVNFIADGLALDKISPFFFVDGPSDDLSIKLNRESSGGTPKSKRLPLASRSSANVIIAGIRGNAPSIYTNDGLEIQKIGTVKPYSGDKSPESILTWIYQCFGYDGIILGRKGSYVIVGGPSSIFAKEKIQALAIRGSESQLALLDKKRSGVSLLELEASKGPYAIFKILALAKDTSTLPTATKLTIQRDSKSN